MEKAIIILQGCGQNEYVNILGDRFERDDKNLSVYYDGNVVAVFALENVKAAWLSIKDFRKA